MEMATIMPYAVLALGGAIGGNILGALTRGGGGVVGRTLVGAIGGVALGYIAGPPGTDVPAMVAAIDVVAVKWESLLGEGAEHNANLGNLISGAAGGGVLGLIGGLLIRPRD